MNFAAFIIGCFTGSAVTILSLALANAASCRDDWRKDDGR